MSKSNSFLNFQLLYNTGKVETAKSTISPGNDQDLLDPNPGIGHNHPMEHPMKKNIRFFSSVNKENKCKIIFLDTEDKMTFKTY